MKKILIILSVILCLSICCVSAQNTYGLSDEYVSFLNEFNIDIDIFAEVFNGEEDENTLEQLERNLWSIKAQTRAYGFNELQVKAMVTSEVRRILNYRKVEYVIIPSFNVTLNGQNVDSTCRRYPLLVFRDITYFPMTYDDLRFLGVTTNWDDKSKKLTIKKEPVENAKYNDYKYGKNLGKYIFDSVEGIYGQVKTCEFEVEINGKIIDNSKEEHPLLLFNNVTYFPLTWRFAVDEFGWDYSFTDENGLEINSK